MGRGDAAAETNAMLEGGGTEEGGGTDAVPNAVGWRPHARTAAVATLTGAPSTAAACMCST